MVHKFISCHQSPRSVCISQGEHQICYYYHHTQLRLSSHLTIIVQAGATKLFWQLLYLCCYYRGVMVKPDTITSADLKLFPIWYRCSSGSLISKSSATTQTTISCSCNLFATMVILFYWSETHFGGQLDPDDTVKSARANRQILGPTVNLLR